MPELLLTSGTERMSHLHSVAVWIRSHSYACREPPGYTDTW